MKQRTTINVARIINPATLEVDHFFKVEMQGHHPDSADVEEVYRSLKLKYPEPYFNIDVTYWHESGSSVNMEAEERVG